MPRKSKPDLNKICIKCKQVDRGSRGDCNECNRRTAYKLRAKRAEERGPCPTCGGTNWTKGGCCRDCIARSRNKKVNDPCSVCGGKRNKWAACFTCKRQDERVRNGIKGAHGDTGVGKPCGICRVKLEDNGPAKYALDHDHATGVIRGWLCIRCNAGIGSLNESPTLLRSAALYIEKHQQPSQTVDREPWFSDQLSLPL